MAPTWLFTVQPATHHSGFRVREEKKKREMNFNVKEGFFLFEEDTISNKGLFLSNYITGKIVNITKYWRLASLVKK